MLLSNDKSSLSLLQQMAATTNECLEFFLATVYLINYSFTHNVSNTRGEA